MESTFIWGAIAGAVLSHQRSVAAIAQWAHEHAVALVAAFHPQRQHDGPLPAAGVEAALPLGRSETVAT